MPPAFKSAYLIHGDDHGRIAERRARLKDIAEAQGGAQGLELFEGDTSSPEAVAGALNAMTFAMGRRFLIVDGVERWKEKELAPLVEAMAAMPPDTTVTFFAREDGRAKAPAKLVELVKRAGGDVAVEANVKPWELPKWAVARARELGLDLSPEGARMLVSHVGDRQQRLLRELEKLALDLRAPGQALSDLVMIDEAVIAELTAASSQRQAWTLADALLSGDPRAATRVFLQLRAQGERAGGLVYWMSTRLRQAQQVAAALERGESAAQVKRTLRMPPKAADQLVGDAQRVGAERLRAAVEQIADLELATRGGTRGGLGEDTRTLLVIQAIAT
jgi:DNA polymerase-3 subunit delta